MILISIAALLAIQSVGISDMREPSLSPDGSALVLRYCGDIWEVPAEGGTMRCLASGESMEYSPCYSPDGTLLAFTSDRSGGGDVYVMGASGGPSTRLTYHAGEDEVICFSAGSDSVYFRSSREGGADWVWSVSVSGGTPHPVARVESRGFCLMPEGFALERGYTPWWRMHYSGSASSDIWIGSGTSWEPIVSTGLDERWPMYSTLTGELLFVMEDLNGISAIWSVVAGEEPVQRTHLESGSITFPAISADGGMIVFEYDGGLVSMTVPGWELQELYLDPSSDSPILLEYADFVGYYTDYFAVDTSGVLMAVVAMGDLFAGVIENGDIEDIEEVCLGAGRAEDPVWSPDGSMLAFTLEHDGRVDLMIADYIRSDSTFTESGPPVSRVLQTAAEVAEYPAWSPDGGSLSYIDADGRLHAVNIRTGSDITLCETTDIIHQSWSPDGRWLAFSAPVLAHREEVFIVSSTGGEPINVSRHPNDDFQPFWPSDGHRLLYASRTDEGEYSIKQVWLSRQSWDLGDDEREELLDQPAIQVDIQWEGLQRRTETLCNVTGYYDFYGASPDGRLIAFPGWDSSDRMDLWTVDWRGESTNRLTWSNESPAGITVTADGTIYYIGSGGIIRSATEAGGFEDTYGWRMPVWRSVPLLQAQKFDEAWRLLRDNFYDPGMHGADWDAIRDEYRSRAIRCITSEDFNDVVRRMLGELSASHLGIWGPWGSRWTPRAASIGIIPDHSWDGPGIRIDSVIPYSPADLDISMLLPGDVITEIHGMQVGADDNLYRPLLQRSGMKTAITVRRGGLLFDMEIDPVSEWAVSRLLYDEWIERNRRLVSQLTDDRIGYLHIPSMDGRSVEQFLVDLFAEGLYRDGMIIDIRFNGGGSTHDQILTALGRPEYALSRDRSGSVTFEPLGVWQRPLVLLINEKCYSDAEIFPAAWKELGLGPVVGETTYGAVIGTIDVDLVDGATFRLPTSGWYTLDGTNLENTGVEPDIHIPDLPADEGLGIDRQLKAGIEAILPLI